MRLGARRTLLRGPGQQLFRTSPADLPGLFMWFDASDDATVIRSGADVSAWNDKSAAANHLTATNNPQYSATSFPGSKPGVTFTQASSQYAQRTGFALNSAALSIVLVHRRYNGTTDGIAALLGSGSSNDFGNKKSFVVDRSGTTTRMISDNSADGYNKTISGADDNSLLFITTWNGSIGQTFGQSIAATPGIKRGAFGDTTASFILGARYGAGSPSNFSNLVVGECFMTTDAFSAADIAAIRSYCSAKWATV